MSFDPTIVLPDNNATDVEFVKIYDDQTGAYRRDSGTELPEERKFDIRHTNAADKEKDIIDRHNTVWAVTKVNPTTGKAKTTSLNVTFNQDRLGIVDSEDIADLVSMMVNFYGVISGTDIICNDANVNALRRGER